MSHFNMEKGISQAQKEFRHFLQDCSSGRNDDWSFDPLSN
jgi:hypothetical protein